MINTRAPDGAKNGKMVDNINNVNSVKGLRALSLISVINVFYSKWILFQKISF